MKFEKSPRPTTTTTGQGSAIETCHGVAFHQIEITDFESRRLKQWRFPMEGGQNFEKHHVQNRRTRIKSGLVMRSPNLPANENR